MNIDFKNVSFSYSDREKGALKDINLKIRQGEFVLLAGASGCGKTTITRILNGLIPGFYNGKLEGNVSIDGRSISEDMALKLLDKMGLLEFKNLHPNTLSGGQKQRLAIAVSLMMDKEILLFDEPTSGLDYKNMRLCADFLKRLADKGKIIIVVTHDEEFMDCCSDEIYHLA